MNPAELPSLRDLPPAERLRLVEQLWKQYEGAAPAAGVAIPAELSVEAQMAAYEAHLKETDWGHQPC